MFSITMSPALATELAREQTLQAIDDGRRARASRRRSRPDRARRNRPSAPSPIGRTGWSFGLQGRAAH